MIASGAVRADPENPRLVRIEKAEKTADG